MLKANFIINRSWPRRMRQAWQAYHLSQWQQPTHPRFLLCPEREFPRFVRDCPVTMTAVRWLRLFDWHCLRPKEDTHLFGRSPIPHAAYIGAFLLKIEHQLASLGQLRHLLVTHPGLIWALGFPLLPGEGAHGFTAEKSVPTRRHLGHVLRHLPNEALQKLLDAQVAQLQHRLPASFGQTISLDTKHVIAWVRQNNPKVYIKEGRYDPDRQPKGDLDCKVGCKRRHNRFPTPAQEGQAVSDLPSTVGEFYWGYASGAVVTKVPEMGEFVLAELTQTFDKGDTLFFFPLMAQVERRLGFRPLYAALDAAFDAWYVHEFFHSSHHDGFAAVPFNQPDGQVRLFDKRGLPLCAAELPMPVRRTYMDRTKSIIPHQRAFHTCPLLWPTATADACPVNHQQWSKGGCTAQFPTSIGARLRHQLVRDSHKYKVVYAQRTAVERIFSQALHLGIERPKLRNQLAITNHNSLIYLIINNRALRRLLPD